MYVKANLNKYLTQFTAYNNRLITRFQQWSLHILLNKTNKQLFHPTADYSYYNNLLFFDELLDLDTYDSIAYLRCECFLFWKIFKYLDNKRH